MIRLTNAHPDRDVQGTSLYLAPDHIVSIRPVGAGSGILSTGGMDYRVAEPPEAVATLCKPLTK